MFKIADNSGGNPPPSFSCLQDVHSAVSHQITTKLVDIYFFSIKGLKCLTVVWLVSCNLRKCVNQRSRFLVLRPVLCISAL